MVDFRINETLPIGEVRKTRYRGGKNTGYPPVGAVKNRTASARPDNRDPDLSGETAPTKHGERKCLFIFRIHHKCPYVVCEAFWAATPIPTRST